MEKRRWGTLDPFFEPGDVLGRKVANRGFFEALMEADPYDEYHFFLPGETPAASHAALYNNAFPRQAARGAFHFFPQHMLHTQLERTPYSVFHLSDPITTFTRLVRLRNAYAPYIFPITATTHSLSYERYLPAYLAHLWQGTSSKDVIVGTSHSAVAMLQATFGMLQENMPCPHTSHMPGITRIPLGASAFFSAPAGKNPRDFFAPEGAAMRARLGLQDKTIFLCLARLTVHSKMDLAPLLAAMHRAKGQGLDLENTVLVIAGWVEKQENLPEALTALAKSMGIRLVIFPCPTNEECRALYAAANIFISPSDNIQETFGLTIAEAASMGLPAIASNFDGYRDIIEDGITGILVPAIGPATSAETNLLAGLWFDNQYHLRLAQQTCVSVPALANAMVHLGTNATLQQDMGNAACTRAAKMFTWQTVLQQYITLWETLAKAPLAADETKRLREATHPFAPDFARSFASHFSHTLHEQSAMLLCRTPLGEAVFNGHVPPLLYAGMENMVEKEPMRRMLLALRKPVAAGVLVQQLAALWPNAQPAIAGERAAILLLWALKHDYIEEYPAPSTV